MNSDFKFKSNPGVVNIDEAQGIVECFVAGIGNKDSVGDIVISGAFAKSLTRRKPRVVWGHSWNDPIGKVLEMYEVPPNDSRLPAKMKAAGIGGLYARVQFNLQSDKGKEAFASVAFFGTDQEWSIGYKTIDAIFDPNLQANVLKEVELYEVSPVLHGANQLTGTISVKNHPVSPAMPAMMPMTMDQMPRIIIVSSDSIGEPEEEREEDDEQELNLFAEGLAQPLTDEQKAKIQSELSERTGSKVEITHATEGSIVFKRTTTDGKTSMYRVGYHTPDDYNTFMFGKPEIYADGKKPQAETEIQSKPNPDTPVVLADGGASYRENEQQMSSFLGSEENVNPWGKSLAMHLIQLPGYSMKDASQKLSSIFEYHKLDVVETNNGLLVTSQLSSDAMDALQVAVKGIGQTIGQSAGTLRSMSEGFNPRAIDGDNDGFAQDNTAFMRPYIPIGSIDTDLPDIGGEKRNSSELLDKPSLGSKIPAGDPSLLAGTERQAALAAGKLTPRTREDMMFLADRRPNNPGLAKYWDMNDNELTLAGQRLKSQRSSVSSNERGPIDTELYKISHEFTRRQSYEQQFGKKFTPPKGDKKKPEKLNAAGRTAEQEAQRMEKFRADADTEAIDDARALGSRSGEKPKKPNAAGRTAEQEELRNEKLRDGVNDDLITEAYERGELGSRSNPEQTAAGQKIIKDMLVARGYGRDEAENMLDNWNENDNGTEEILKSNKNDLLASIEEHWSNALDRMNDDKESRSLGSRTADKPFTDTEIRLYVAEGYNWKRSSGKPMPAKAEKRSDEILRHWESLTPEEKDSYLNDSSKRGFTEGEINHYAEALGRAFGDKYRADIFARGVEAEKKAKEQRVKAKKLQDLLDGKDVPSKYGIANELSERIGLTDEDNTPEIFSEYAAAMIENWQGLSKSQRMEAFRNADTDVDIDRTELTDSEFLGALEDAWEDHSGKKKKYDSLNERLRYEFEERAMSEENRWDDYQSRNLGSRSKPLGSRMPNEGERIMQRGNRDFLSDEFSSSEYRQAMSGLDKVRKGDGKVTPEEDAAIQKLGKLYKARNNTTTNQRNAINDVLKNVNGYASGRQERRALGSRGGRKSTDEYNEEVSDLLDIPSLDNGSTQNMDMRHADLLKQRKELIEKRGRIAREIAEANGIKIDSSTTIYDVTDDDDDIDLLEGLSTAIDEATENLERNREYRTEQLAKVDEASDIWAKIQDLESNSISFDGDDGEGGLESDMRQISNKFDEIDNLEHSDGSSLWKSENEKKKIMDLINLVDELNRAGEKKDEQGDDLVELLEEANDLMNVVVSREESIAKDNYKNLEYDTDEIPSVDGYDADYPKDELFAKMRGGPLGSRQTLQKIDVGDSQAIDDIHYDDMRKELHVGFTSSDGETRRYTYFGVSQAEADAIDKSPSKGRAINDIKRNHDVEKIDSAALKRVTGTSDERMISPLTDSSGKYPGIGEPIDVSGSSALEDAFYDPRKRELVVKFKDGGSYVYEGVLPGEASALNSAPSKGRAINDIKKNHPVRKYEKEAGSSKLEWSETSGTSSETSGRSGLDYTIEKQADGTFAVEAGKSTYSYQDGPDFETVDTADGFETEDAAKAWAAQHDFAIIERESAYDKIDRDNERSRRNQPVDVGYSSAIESASWDERNNELSITYKGGKKYIYSDFTQDDLDKFEANPSKGRAANEVKKNHPVRKADSGPLGSGYEPSGGFRSQDPAYASDDDVMGDPYYDEIYEEVLLEVTSDEYLEDFLKINQDGYSPFTDEELTKLYKEEKWQEIAEGMREQIIEAFGARIENRAIDLTEQRRQSRYDRSDRLGSRSGPLGSNSRMSVRDYKEMASYDDLTDSQQSDLYEKISEYLNDRGEWARVKNEMEDGGFDYDEFLSDNPEMHPHAEVTLTRNEEDEIRKLMMVRVRGQDSRDEVDSMVDHWIDQVQGNPDDMVDLLEKNKGNLRAAINEAYDIELERQLDARESRELGSRSGPLGSRGDLRSEPPLSPPDDEVSDDYMQDAVNEHVFSGEVDMDDLKKYNRKKIVSDEELQKLYDDYKSDDESISDEAADTIEKTFYNEIVDDRYDIMRESYLSRFDYRDDDYDGRGTLGSRSNTNTLSLDPTPKEELQSFENYLDSEYGEYFMDYTQMDDEELKKELMQNYRMSRSEANALVKQIRKDEDRYDDLYMAADNDDDGEVLDSSSGPLGSRSESFPRTFTPQMPDIDDMDEEDASDALEKSNEELLDFIDETEKLAREALGDDGYLKEFSGAVPYIEELSKDHDGGVEERSIALEQAIDRAELFNRAVSASLDPSGTREINRRIEKLIRRQEGLDLSENGAEREWERLETSIEILMNQRKKTPDYVRAFNNEGNQKPLGSRSSGNIDDVDVSESSALDSAYYHAPTGELVVSYAGGRSYVYEGVSNEEFQNFNDSPSKGRAINEIKRTHGFRVASDEDRNDRIAGDRSEGDAMSRGALESNWKRIGSAEQQRYLSRETNSAISSGSGQSTDELLNAAQMRAMDDRNMADLEMQAESVGSGGRSIDVSSSQALNRVTYDKENELLSVEYRGRDGKGAGTVYEYQGVPEDVVASLESSDSRGAALRQIRDDYEFTTRDALPDSAYDKTSSKPLGSRGALGSSSDEDRLVARWRATDKKLDEPVVRGEKSPILGMSSLDFDSHRGGGSKFTLRSESTYDIYGPVNMPIYQPEAVFTTQFADQIVKDFSRSDLTIEELADRFELTPTQIQEVLDDAQANMLELERLRGKNIKSFGDNSDIEKYEKVEKIFVGERKHTDIPEATGEALAKKEQRMEIQRANAENDVIRRNYSDALKELKYSDEYTQVETGYNKTRRENEQREYWLEKDRLLQRNIDDLEGTDEDNLSILTDALAGDDILEILKESGVDFNDPTDDWYEDDYGTMRDEDGNEVGYDELEWDSFDVDLEGLSAEERESLGDDVEATKNLIRTRAQGAKKELGLSENANSSDINMAIKAKNTAAREPIAKLEKELGKKFPLVPVPDEQKRSSLYEIVDEDGKKVDYKKLATQYEKLDNARRAEFMARRAAGTESSKPLGSGGFDDASVSPELQDLQSRIQTNLVNPGSRNGKRNKPIDKDVAANLANPESDAGTLVYPSTQNEGDYIRVSYNPEKRTYLVERVQTTRGFNRDEPPEETVMSNRTVDNSYDAGSRVVEFAQDYIDDLASYENNDGRAAKYESSFGRGGDADDSLGSSSGSWPTPSGYEPDEFNMNETMSQIGRGNIAAISGGRVVKRGNEMVLPVNRNQQVVVGYNGGSDTYYVRAEQIITSGKDKGKHKILAQWGEVYAENVGETAYNASLKPSMHSEENADFWKTSDLIPKNTLVDSQTGEKISNARPLGSRGSGRGAITGGNSRASIPNGDDSLYDEANGPGNSIRRRGSYSPPNQRLLARQDRADAIENLAQKNIARMDILRKTNPKRFREMLKRENVDRRDWRELAYRDATNAIDQLARYQERRASGNGVRRPPGGNLPKVDPSPRGDGLSPFANLKDGDIVTLDNGVFKVNGTEELRGALGSRAFNYGPETEAKTKAEAMKVLTDQLIKSIESAETGEWKMPWRVTTLPINPTTGRMYSGSNFLMLSVIGEARGYSSPQWAGYDQWAQKGGQVRKGAKGVPVFIPIPFKGKLDPVTNEEDGGGMSWKMIRVFNRDEIDGLPEDFANPPVLPEGTRIDNLEKTLSQIAPKITNGGSRAFYRPSDDSITVPEFKNFKSARDYYGTVAHEIMHWTGHKSRLNRDHMGQFGTPEYAYEELVAEIASAMFVGAHGLEPNIQENHGPYLKHWLKKLKDDPTALQRAIKDAQAAFDYVNGASPNLRGLMGSEDNGGLETSGKTVGKLSKPLGSMTSRPGIGLTANDVRDIDSDQLDSIMNHFGPQNVYNARPGEITQEDYEDIAKFLNNLTAEEVMGFSNRNRGTSKPLGSRSSSSVTDGKPKSARAKLEDVPVPPIARDYDENRTSSDAYEDTEMEIGSYLESLSNAMKEIVGDDEFEKTFKPRVDSIIDDMRDERSEYAGPPDWALNRAWKLHKEMVSQSRMREPLGSSSGNGPLGSRMNLSQSEKNEIIAMARQMRKSNFAKSVVAQYDTNGGQLSDGQWAALNRMTLRGGGRNAMGSRSEPKKPRTPKGGWAPEDRQRFADRDILKSRKVPGKRRPGPSASEYGALGSRGTSAFVNGRTVDMEPRQDTKPLQIGLNDIIFESDGKGKSWALDDLARSSSEFRNITPQELMARYGISERAALAMKKPGAKIRDPYLADELTNAFGFTPSEIWGPNNPTAYQNADGSLVDLSDLFEKPDKDFDPELDGSLPVVELPDADATLEGISSADEARKVRKRVGGSRSGKLSSGYDAQVLLNEIGYNGSRSRRALEQAFPEISEKRWRAIAGKDSTTGLTVGEVNSILKRLKSNKTGTDIFGESFESGTQTPIASIFRNPLIVANIEKRGGMNAVAEAYKKATGRSISRAQSYRLRDSKDSITSTELRVMLNELGISVEEFDARNKG